MDTSIRCESIEWDSAFFGVRIARLTGPLDSPQAVLHLQQWLASSRSDCVYYLAEIGSAGSVRAAENLGFRYVDVRATLEREIAEPAPVEDVFPENVHTHCDADLPALRALARLSHRETRFYADPRFPRKQCDALYETWIENECRGGAAAVLVATGAGGLQGYLTCHLEPPNAGRIGLFAVDAAARGRGVGSRLLGCGLKWFAARGVHRLSVVTQGHNRAALRVYQRQGFAVSSLQLWLHWWRQPSEEERRL